MSNTTQRTLGTPVVTLCTAFAVLSVTILLSVAGGVTFPLIAVVLGVLVGLASVLKQYHDQTTAARKTEVIAVLLGVMGGVGGTLILVM
jgi:type III secretory pathway component EscS